MAANGLYRGPEGPAAHVRIYLALLPSGPDAVRRLKLHRFRTAVQSARTVRLDAGHHASVLHGHARREQQVLREHFTDDDGEEIDVENAGRRLRRSNLGRLPS